ncbi:MAG: large subunit ribosomal protein L22 [Lysobacterales bacterium]|jgi:large subunit ribosomal protein L22
MIAQAKGKYIRVSSTKMRRVIDLIRGKDVGSSSVILMHAEKGCAPLIKKILDSAVDNAKQKGITEDKLYISKITANQGPVWKRFRAAAFGRAAGIVKKTSHLTIELDLKK